MRNTVLFFLFLLLALGVTLGIYFYPSPKPAVIVPQKVTKTTFSLSTPPTDALPAMIVSFVGQVLWESRTATVSSPFGNQQVLLQGESVQTGNNGSITLSYPESGTISVSPQTQFAIVESLPTHFVFSQDGGTVRFTASQSASMSDRVLGLIVETQGGVSVVSSDDTTGDVVVRDISGTVRTGYNDVNYNTQTATLSAGETFVYDDPTQTSEVY